MILFEDDNNEYDYEDEENENNAKNTSEDPRQKVINLIEKIFNNFKKYYYPNTDLIIDESLIYFRGRSKLKFYIPMKPHKWGFKFHIICESNSIMY